MGLIATGTSRSTNPLPPESYPARCVKVVDLGTQPGYTWQGSVTKPNRKILIEWELPTELFEEGDYAGKPRVISREFTLSIHEKSKLYELLVAWRGKKFTDEEATGFNLLTILGAPCLLRLIVNEKGYNEIGSVQPYSTKLMAPCPAQILPSVAFDFDLWRSGDQDQNKIYGSLPQWMQDKINGALEMQTPDVPSSTGDILQDDIPF